MSIQLSKEIKIGILGVIAILLFVFGYNYLKGSGLFSTSRTVKVIYDNVQGLTPASYVQVQGFTVGAVKSIHLSKTNPGKVEVVMNVDKSIEIPVDSKARIVSLDLLGTKAVNLIKGTSTSLVKNNELIAGDIELGTIESLGASAGPAIDNVKTTIASLDQTITSVNTILDANTQRNLQNAIADMSKTMKEFSQFANELNAQRAKIGTLLDNLNAFSTNLNKNNTTINKVLTNAEVTTSNLSKLNFESTLNELKTTMDGLQTTLNKINNGNGTMSLLLNDDKLYKNLKNTLSTANNLLYDINARPSRYINVNVFGKKQKNECPPAPAPNSND